MLFFTSDLHLGHEHALSFAERKFACVEEMNNKFISNINEIVGENDELWILGDFAYRVNKEEVRKFRKRILCRNVNLVYGNHDKDYSQDHIFQSVQYYKELKTEYGMIVLFHYPIVEWNRAHYGTIHLHGHIHSTGKYNRDNLTMYFKDRFPNGHRPKNQELKLRIYDVGVDANNYRPISFEDIAALMGLEPTNKLSDNL